MSIRPEKIQFFEKVLNDFFLKAGREHLPWRKKRVTAYEVWISEIMLQQTQVVRVVEYYKKFIKRFPTVQDLAKASWEEFLPYYEGLGYYARGRNMLKASQVIVNKHGGKFPRDKKLLEELPGVGSYTASAIMSFAYNDNHLAWDTNLKRVIGRFFFGGKHLIEDENVWEGAFQTERKILNAALMDFGSALCISRPRCEACALRSACTYYKEKGEREAVNSKQKAVKQNEGERADAQVILFLHENHKKYFSINKKALEPFVLSSGYNTRAGIKKYFLEKYGLTLSVRPPFASGYLKKKPIIFVHAQILLGEHAFSVFSNADYKSLERKLLLEK